MSIDGDAASCRGASPELQDAPTVRAVHGLTHRLDQRRRQWARMLLVERPHVDLPLLALIVATPQLPVEPLIGGVQRVGEARLRDVRVLGELDQHPKAVDCRAFPVPNTLHVDVARDDEVVRDRADELDSADAAPPLDQPQLVNERERLRPPKVGSVEYVVVDHGHSLPRTGSAGRHGCGRHRDGKRWCNTRR